MSCSMPTKPAGNQANPLDAKGRLGEFEFLVVGREKTRDRIAYFLREAFDFLPAEAQQRIVNHWHREREQSTVLPELSPFIALLQARPDERTCDGHYTRLVADVAGRGHFLHLTADLIDDMPDFALVVSLGVVLASVNLFESNVAELTDEDGNVHGLAICDEFGTHWLPPDEFESRIQRIADEWGFDVEGWRQWLQNWTRRQKQAVDLYNLGRIRTTDSREKGSPEKQAEKQRNGGAKSKKNPGRNQKRGQE